MNMTNEQRDALHLLKKARWNLHAVTEALEAAPTSESQTLQYEAFKLARDAHDVACDEFQSAFIRVSSAFGDCMALFPTIRVQA